LSYFFARFFTSNMGCIIRVQGSKVQGSGFKGSEVQASGYWFLAAAEGCPTTFGGIWLISTFRNRQSLGSDICLPLSNL